MQHQIFVLETADIRLSSIQEKTTCLCQRADRPGKLQIVLVASIAIPIFNTVFDRGFSSMNWIKNKRKNRHSQNSLLRRMLLGRYKTSYLIFEKSPARSL